MVDQQQALRNRAKNWAPYDVLLRNGTVIDPSVGLHEARDVAFAYGRVAAVAPAGSVSDNDARVIVDASDTLVTPGLIDLHTHVYVGGGELVVPADEVGPPSGTTTMVELGTAGANTMLGFRMLAQQTRTRLYAFVHISNFGLAGHPHGESRDLLYLDPELAARAVLAHQGFVLGVKVRQTAGLVGENGIEPLRRAVQAAEIAQQTIGDAYRVRVAVHIGGAPAPLSEVMALLRPGDMVTHCFNGGQRDVLRDDGTLEPAAREARAKGVLFDVGHGNGSFVYRVAKGAADAGFWPDTISTDLHSMSVQYRAVDMPTTMTKFLGLGMPLDEVIARSTLEPARVIGMSLPERDREPLLGTLQVGAPGDAALLKLDEGEFTLYDCTDFSWKTERRLRAVGTVLHGRMWGRPYAHPYLIP
ncbi:MAG TPA: amidohydrolase/deacetylase family metallohydrolase [Chloroflexota bacterium]|nr:amidohydrolase/deacetylase family metallohydrolase [Chloroflexota bacterium]